MKNTPTKIIIHCSDVSQDQGDQFNSINAYHKSEDFLQARNGLYIGYHVLVTKGKLYKCKEDDEEGCHCNQVSDGVSINLQSLGICWGGDGDIEYPNPENFALIKKQVLEWQDKYNISTDNVFYHRQWNTLKTCPGSLLGLDWKNALLTRSEAPKPAAQVDKQAEIVKGLQGQISAYQEQISGFQRLIASLKSLLGIK